MLGCLRRPARLREADIVAVATPSSPVVTPRRLARGLAALRQLGFRPVVGPLANTASSDAEARACELNTFIRDPDVRCILMATGGYSSNGTLAHLDYDALRADPKILIGYSDITSVLLAALRHAGVVTFHGPTLLPELAEFPRPLPYTADWLLRATMHAEPLGPLRPASIWTEELLHWDEADNRPRHLRPSDGWRHVHGGSASGILLGGNLETLSILAGTPYLPSFRGAVLFWETTSVRLDQVERILVQLESLGAFDQMAGMLVGRSFRAPDGFEAALVEHVRHRFAGAGVPVIASVDLGHTDPMLTLPLGVQARVDGSRGTVEVLDAGVS